jgi:fibronectin type 3 domain-containing protein
VTVNVTEPGGVPAAPTNLQATAGKRRVTLRWSQSTSPDIAQNRIYRSTDGSSYALLSTISATTFYSDRAVTSGTTYYYVVTAVNGSGLEGPYSNAASAVPR